MTLTQETLQSCGLKGLFFKNGGYLLHFERLQKPHSVGEQVALSSVLTQETLQSCD